MRDKVGNYKVPGILLGLVILLTSLVYHTLLPVLAVFVCACMAIIIWRPLIGFALMLFFIPLENLTLLFPSFSMIKLTGIITFWGWLMHVLVGKKLVKLNCFFLLLALFILWCTASVAWAIEPGQSMRRIISMGQLLMMVFLGYNLVDNKKELYLVLGSYLLGALVASGLGIYNGYLHEFTVRTDIGNFNDPNYYARHLLLGAIFCGYLTAMAGRVAARLAGVASLAVLLFAVMLSGSRGAWIAALVTLVAGLVMILPPAMQVLRKKRVLLPSLVAVVIFTAVFCPYIIKHLPPVVVQRAQTLTQVSDQFDRGAGRIDIWMVGLNIAGDNWIKGVGINNFPYAYTRYFSGTGGVDRFIGLNRDAHNNYLTVFAELGIPGFLLFLWLFYSAWRFSGRAESRADAVAGKLVIIFLLFSGLTSTDIFTKFFWLGMAMPVLWAQFGFGKEIGRPGGGTGPGEDENRVLFFSPIFPNRVKPTYGIFALHLVKSLRAAGTPVDVVAPVPWAPALLWFNKKWRDMGRIPWQEYMDGVQVLHPRFFCLPGRRLGGWNMLFMYWATYPVIKILHDRVRYKIIHSYGVLPAGFAGLMAARKLNLHSVCTAIGSDINVVAGETAIMRKRAGFVLENTGQVVTVSGDLAQRAKKITASPPAITAIYEGVDSDVFDTSNMDRNQAKVKLGLKPSNRVIFFAGGLVREKGVYELIDVFARVNRSFPGTVLAIAGQGKEKNPLCQLVEQMGLREKVIFAGQVPHQQLVWWYAASECVVLLSRHEGVPNVIKEAMSCSRPVVATRVTGIPELVVDGESGMLVNHIDEAVQALELLLADPELGRKMGNRARQAILEDRWSWRHTARAYRNVYRRLLTDGGSRQKALD